MDPDSIDSVALLKSAEDEARAKADSARKAGALLVKKGNERATSILETAERDAQAAKAEVYESVRAASVGEAKAVLAQAKAEADQLKGRRLDGGLVSDCFKMFLGDCGV